MNIREIQKILPHRYPFLLVDRMVEIELGKRGVGYKNVTITEPFFQGHYPDFPVMPGVLILESIAQVGALVLLSDPAYKDVKPLIVGADKVRFRRMVVPGDQLVTEAEIQWFRKGIGSMRGVAKVDGEIAAEAILTFKILDEGKFF